MIKSAPPTDGRKRTGKRNSGERGAKETVEHRAAGVFPCVSIGRALLRALPVRNLAAARGPGLSVPARPARLIALICYGRAP
jgi:hypothetical protein